MDVLKLIGWFVFGGGISSKVLHEFHVCYLRQKNVLFGFCFFTCTSLMLHYPNTVDSGYRLYQEIDKDSNMDQISLDSNKNRNEKIMIRNFTSNNEWMKGDIPKCVTTILMLKKDNRMKRTNLSITSLCCNPNSLDNLSLFSLSKYKIRLLFYFIFIVSYKRF